VTIRVRVMKGLVSRSGHRRQGRRRQLRGRRVPIAGKEKERTGEAVQGADARAAGGEGAE